jgi:hypothetical protein
MEYLNYTEFDKLLNDIYGNFLPRRKKVYFEIFRYLEANNISLIFLTQPHAYRKDFKPRDEDLRLFPTFENKKMTLEQSSKLMDIINNHTLDLAQTMETPYIDVAACFSLLNPSPLFYDSVHYTLSGSRHFAKCVNQSLPVKPISHLSGAR